MSKILIIEDDSLLAKLYGSALKGAGFETDIALNGQEGLDRIVGGGYDLVLLDVMMPVMDGLTVLDRLKALEAQKSKTPIVVMTNLSGGIEKKALEAGAIAYIDKSKTKAGEIVEKVKSFIGK